MNAFAQLLHHYFNDPQMFAAGFSLLVFAIAYLESFVIIGFIMPGTVLLFGAAAVAINQNLIPHFLLCTAIGGFLADLSSFYFGTRGNRYILSHAKKYPETIKRIHHFFHAYGALTIIIGKLVGTLRPLTSFVAGTSGMSVKKYAIITAFASSIWAVSYLLIVYYCDKYLPHISREFAIIGIIIVLIIVIYLIISRDTDRPHLQKHE